MAVAGVRALAGIMIALLGQCGVACAAQGQADAFDAQPPQASPAPRVPAVIHFDMPRQPLQAALDQYHALTGQSLLYEGAVVEGRIAAPVQGDMGAAAALDALLAGTGIVARYTSGDAFMLMREPAASAPPLADAEPPFALVIKRNYYGLLQARVLAALCGNPDTIPGAYRLALNLWIGAGRTVERVVIHPTGDPRRDAAILKVLDGLALQSAPPAGVVLPITLVILPRAPSETGDCAAPVREEAP